MEAIALGQLITAQRARDHTETYKLAHMQTATLTRRNTHTYKKAKLDRLTLLYTPKSVNASQELADEVLLNPALTRSLSLLPQL